MHREKPTKGAEQISRKRSHASQLPHKEESMPANKTAGSGKAKVHKVMKEYKHGSLKSGSGGKVKSRKQAVAIALSEARSSGAKIPKKKARS
jgi:hypothetical protein